MARKKTRLAYLTNDATRRITLKKRRLGILKKVYELSVLCNVRACAIIYSPQEPEPEVWPSAAEARDLLSRFNATETFGKSNNMMNQEKFLSKEIVNLRTQLDRLMEENDDLAGKFLLSECLSGRLASSFDNHELGLLGSALARRIEAVEGRLLMLSNNMVESQPLSPLIPPPAMQETVVGGVDFWIDGGLEWEQGLWSGCDGFWQPNF